MALTNPGSIETGNLNRLPDLQVINYTGLDFKSIKAKVIDFVRKNYPDTQNDFIESTAFSMLVDIMSYINDVLAFRADFLSNEAYLPTASTEKSINNLLRLINYDPLAASAASGEVKITLEDADPELLNGDVLKSDLIISDSNSPLVIRFADESGNPLSSEIFPSNTNRVGTVEMIGNVNKIGDSIYATVIEGTTSVDTVTLGTSVSANYSFKLTYSNILTDDLTLTVNGVPWNRTKNFAYENGATFTYELKYDENGVYSVVFGDGVFGAIPPANSFVEVRYRYGGGQAGNVSSHVIDRSITVPSQGKSATVRIENITSLTGGQDREDLNFSRFIAPKNFATQLRAVTGEDYTIWALSYRDGTNGSISKAVTTLRPYLASYFRSNGPYDITDSNKYIQVKINDLVKTITLSPGSAFTALQIAQQIQDQIDNVVYSSTENHDIESFIYPSYAYKILPALGFAVDKLITIDSSNNKFTVRHGDISTGGTLYAVELTPGDYTIAQIVDLTNFQLATGNNSSLQLFRADSTYYDSAFRLDFHTTGWFNPSTTYFQFEFTSGQSNDFYTLFGFAIPQVAAVYTTYKPALGFVYHTPDSALEVMDVGNSAYSVLGIDYSTIISGITTNGIGRALPMAANYVDLFVLAAGPQNIVTTASDNLKLALKNFFQRLKVLTDKVTVWDGILKYVSPQVSVFTTNNANLETVRNIATAYLSEYMSGKYNEFGESFYISKVYELLESIDGVAYVDIDDILVNGISQVATGSKQVRNVDTIFNEIWVRDTIAVNVAYKQ